MWSIKSKAVQDFLSTVTESAYPDRIYSTFAKLYGSLYIQAQNYAHIKTGVTDLLPVVSQTCTVPLSTFTNTILLSELDCLFISETANWAAFWTYESFKFFKGLGAPTNDARMGTHDPSRHKKNRDFCLTFMIPITVLGVD